VGIPHVTGYPRAVLDDAPDYSIVVPIYNEQETLPALHARLAAVIDQLDGPAEVVLVNDGSSDGSWPAMQGIHEADARFRIVGLSRNFGHQIAVTAGLDLSRGRAIVVIDADLQDPPELIVEMAARWREGYDVVYAVREARAGETRFKLKTAAWFYRLMRRLAEVQIPADVGDFRLVDRRALDAVRGMRERARYLRGMFAWVGFRQTGVTYHRAERHAGESKYPLRKMLQFALDGLVSFSSLPLRIALNIGFLIAIFAFLLGATFMVLKLAGSYTVPGWASLAVVTSFFAGAQLMMIGIMGEYVGRIYDEVKRRPLYLVSDMEGHELQAVFEERGMLTSEDAAVTRAPAPSRRA
jgi:glycosyltransferase involved in cell wall biosynthesis